MEICQHSTNVWTLCIRDVYFRVNTVTKAIIECIDAGFSNEEIKQKLLDDRYGEILDVDIDALRVAISELHPKKSKQNIIWGKIKILNLGKWKNFLHGLSFLFNPIVSTGVIIAFIMLFICQFESIINVNKSEVLSNVKDRPYMLLVYMIISLVIVLIHEFGHAVAASKYKVPPKEIGFGFYLYFPVFYTDVSNSWLATKYHRVVIDVAGYYFQIISMTILLLISVVFNVSQGMLQLLIWDNVFIILYNLNPLFRFDGYWLFSDLLDIPNLRQKATIAFPELLLAFIGKRKLSHKFRPAVYIYSVISNLFIVIMVCLFAIFVFKNILSAPDSIDFCATVFWSWFVKIVLSLFVCYFSFRSVFFLIKNIISNALQLLREGKTDNTKCQTVN